MRIIRNIELSKYKFGDEDVGYVEFKGVAVGFLYLG